MGKNYLTSELDRIQWTENLPSGCNVELEVCVADDYAEFEDFVSPPAWFGPTGGGNFTTPAGQALPTGKTGRYAMVRATLTGNGSATPTLSDIQLTCNAGSDTGSRVIRTRYDEAGNILRITTIDDLGVSEDVRDDVGWSSGDRINTLNQIMRQDVGGDTWTFSYDLNGNMTGKTNGVDAWTYTWDSLDGRLTRVQGPGGVDVAYGYDYFGRMISRDDGVEVTSFVWDGHQMIRETTGMSTTTYCIPERQLTSFIRDGDRFDVHLDALDSVRMVTDNTGTVVARFDYDAFGNELPGGFDNVPGGMAYKFVGGLGCRTDFATSLVYMRARHYDPTRGRFVSRDVTGLQGGVNLYTYASNAPQIFSDSLGLRNDTPTGGTPVGGGIYRDSPHSYHNYGDGTEPRGPFMEGSPTGGSGSSGASGPGRTPSDGINWWPMAEQTPGGGSGSAGRSWQPPRVPKRNRPEEGPDVPKPDDDWDWLQCIFKLQLIPVFIDVVLLAMLAAPLVPPATAVTEVIIVAYCGCRSYLIKFRRKVYTIYRGPKLPPMPPKNAH